MKSRPELAAVFMTAFGPVRISPKEAQLLRMADTAAIHNLPFPERLQRLEASIVEAVNRVARWKWEHGA